jgi:hypothetical protein
MSLSLPPTKIEVSVGSLCAPTQLRQSFAADARRMLGQPSETYEDGPNGETIIHQPIPDLATVTNLHRQLLATGYEVEVDEPGRTYRIELKT